MYYKHENDEVWISIQMEAFSALLHRSCNKKQELMKSILNHKFRAIGKALIPSYFPV